MTQKQLIRNLQFAVLLLVLITTIACGASGALAQEGSGTYTVQRGDTLARIAKDHGTTVETLVDLNEDSYPSLADNPGLIEVGWTLQLPGGHSADTQGNSAADKPAATPTPAMTIEEAELEIVRLINEERAKVGAPALEVDPVLMEVARLRSEDMVKRGYLGHNDPETGERLYRKMLTDRGYHSPSGEIATKQPHYTSPPAMPWRAVRNWMNSQPHQEIAVDLSYSKVGVGLAIGSNYFIATAILLR